MTIKNITSEEEFYQTIANGYTVVDFHAIWCGPCKMLSPVIDKISTLATDINFAKVDIDQLSNIAEKYKIHNVPTVFLFAKGKPVSHFVGFKSEAQILEFINQNKR